MLTLIALLPLMTAALTLLNNVLADEPPVVKMAGWLALWNVWKTLFLPLMPSDQQALLLALEKQMTGAITTARTPIPPTAQP